MVIDEIDGDYSISNKTKRSNVFGKLFMDKSVNGIITYRPENCSTVFETSQQITHLTVSFMRYDCERIPLNKLCVKKLQKTKNSIQIATTTKHYLSYGDKVNIYQSEKDLLSVNNLKVTEIISDNRVVLEKPTDIIKKGSNLAFEKASIKCTLTFKIITKTN